MHAGVLLSVEKALIFDFADVISALEKARNSLESAELRLTDLSMKTNDRKKTEKTEDQKADVLRRWCIRVRSLVLVPSTADQVRLARPLPNGAVSDAMTSVIEDAGKLGITCFPDVEVVNNCFKCMSWSLYTLSILSRKPKLSELNDSVSQASSLLLPDEKALRTMKMMIQRALQLQCKVSKALAPRPGHTKPLNVEMLKDLAVGLDEIPVRLPEAVKLQIAIDDKGSRHCICGGPSDGRLMLCCDKCESWFHGPCINVEKEASAALKKWICFACSGQPPIEFNPESIISCNDEVSMADSDDYDESPHAPNLEKLWPPFGLLGSPEAAEALGGECSVIPDDKAEIIAVSNPRVDQKNRTSRSVDANKGGDVMMFGISDALLNAVALRTAPVALESQPLGLPPPSMPASAHLLNPHFNIPPVDDREVLSSPRHESYCGLKNRADIIAMNGGLESQFIDKNSRTAVPCSQDLRPGKTVHTENQCAQAPRFNKVNEDGGRPRNAVVKSEEVRVQVSDLELDHSSAHPGKEYPPEHSAHTDFTDVNMMPGYEQSKATGFAEVSGQTFKCGAQLYMAARVVETAESLHEGTSGATAGLATKSTLALPNSVTQSCLKSAAHIDEGLTLLRNGRHPLGHTSNTGPTEFTHDSNPERRCNAAQRDDIRINYGVRSAESNNGHLHEPSQTMARVLPDVLVAIKESGI